MAAARVVVLGAGSVGCFIGGAWQAKGLAVSFIGRPRIANDIAANGLELSDQDGWKARLPPKKVRFATQPDALAKSVDHPANGQERRDRGSRKGNRGAHAKPGTIVLSFQNGVGNIDLLERELGDRFVVMRGIVPFNVASSGRGHFHKGVAGALGRGNAAMRALAERTATGPPRYRSVG